MQDHTHRWALLAWCLVFLVIVQQVIMIIYYYYFFLIFTKK